MERITLISLEGNDNFQYPVSNILIVRNLGLHLSENDDRTSGPINKRPNFKESNIYQAKRSRLNSNSSDNSDNNSNSNNLSDGWSEVPDFWEVQEIDSELIPYTNVKTKNGKVLNRANDITVKYFSLPEGNH